MWKGTDPTAQNSGKGVSKLNVTVDVTTRRVRLYIASTKVAGWNEIDAVALVDNKGGRQWAMYANASSTYASGEPPTSGFLEVVQSLQEE